MADDVRGTYDAVARAYDSAYSDELTLKPLDRALLEGFLSLVDGGPIADLGCGPGHVTRFLAERGADVIGVDLSVGMLDVAREHAPEIAFAAGSMLQLPVIDSAWSGAIALYSIIHLTPDERTTACREFARTVRPGGWLLLAFHIDSPEFAVGTVNHATSWFGHAVHIDGYFLEPDAVTSDVEAAGFTVMLTTIRQPFSDSEYPSRRCYLMARRN
ncbi:class I SAM-dependent methyltransferase [Nocardioides sp. zg-DK7169]|uniref:class I SAM-dependent methyltransferase n=1 Tax=Nocardioides sp. zg-DK7169 TaxID=2736600 RepID=UPI0015581662|nr:class I SAM-dependent methyltransferase [Nocardioides sp. zg-DK7169]NPC98966.1 methyltransferase domain-containing protein [Nocardioides sp. zg-DK7169]